MNKLIAFSIICFVGYFLLIEKTPHLSQLFELQDYITKELKLGVVHIPSFIFILVSWIVSYWLLDSNKTDTDTNTESVYKNLKLANYEMERALEALKKHQIKETQHAYKVITSQENAVLKGFIDFKSQGKLLEDYELELIRLSRDAIHKLEERIQHLSFVATVLPMLGMVGTLAGLMLMATQFSNTDGGEASNAMQNNFEAVGIALLTTLYASLITIAIIKPTAQTYKNKLARLRNQCEIAWQNGVYLANYVEGFFLKIEDDIERNVALIEAYPEQVSELPVKTKSEHP